LLIKSQGGLALCPLIVMPVDSDMTDQDNLEHLARTGMAALQAGRTADARAAFLAIADAGRATPKLWGVIAETSEALGDDATQHRALDALLAENPRDLLALCMKGNLFLKAGDDRAAMGWLNKALTHAATATNLPPEIIARLDQAQEAAQQAAARFERHMQSQMAAATQDQNLPPRFEEALGILTGRQQVYLQQPTSFYYPGLPQTAFYDTSAFDWVPGLESAYPAIRAEAEMLLSDQRGVAPYVQADPARPNRGHALLNDARWSAFHFYKNGQPLADNMGRCPATAAALRAAPLPIIQDRSPMALFSILGPQTHIPPHSGMLNTRLICHLPLIVPPGCRLRVGNHVRPVEAGKVFIFDDSIEHEAWNDSDEMRVILLFEIWRPELSEEERAALTALFDSVSLYSASTA
jgi:aspartyl/asparaginyl beta-hydroxylase (cupin superfamily)